MAMVYVACIKGFGVLALRLHIMYKPLMILCENGQRYPKQWLKIKIKFNLLHACFVPKSN